MKKCLILLLALPLWTFAQRTPGEAEIPQDKKAGEVLDKLSEKTRGYSAIKVEFSYNLVNKDEDIDETQKGTVTLKGEKYLLNIAGQSLTCDGSTIWTYIEDADEVQIDNVPDEEDGDNLMNPAKVFTMYEKGFKYIYDKETPAEHVIKLFPMDPEEKPYHTIILHVSKAKTQLTKVIVKGKDGNIYTYFMDNFHENYSIEDAAFTFDESKAGDVIDLRD